MDSKFIIGTISELISIIPILIRNFNMYNCGTKN